MSALDGLSFNQLRKLAKERGIKIPKGTKQPALVAMLSGDPPPEAPPADDPKPKGKVLNGSVTRVEAGKPKLYRKGDPIPKDLTADEAKRLKRLGVIG